MAMTVAEGTTLVDIEMAGDELIQSMVETLSSHGKSRPGEQACPIHRVPPYIQEADQNAYTPKIISIGPFHRGNFHAMEKIKWKYLHDLFRRSLPSRNRNEDDHFKQVLRKCVERVRSKETEARQCYSEEVSLDSDKFVEMMVLDGCFIIELLINYKEEEEEPALYSTLWSPSHVRMDLQLLENQIPFFILEALFEATEAAGPCPEARRLPLIKMWAVHYLTEGRKSYIPYHCGPIYHLLHLLHLSLRPSYLLKHTGKDQESNDVIQHHIRPYSRQEHIAKRLKRLPFLLGFWLLSPVIYGWNLLIYMSGSSDGAGERWRERIPSASKLRNVGVEFRKLRPEQDDETEYVVVAESAAADGSVQVVENKKGSILDVRFGDGTLEMKQLRIEESTKPQLQNLIAFEQSAPGLVRRQYYSAYAWFMDNLIDEEADAEILERQGIIQSNLGSNNEVAVYFNKLCKGQRLDYGSHYLAELFQAVNKFYSDPRNRWSARLLQVYFSSPWAVLALIAALLALIMSAVQAVFSVLQVVQK